MHTRRDFLRSSALLALAPTVPVFLARTAKAAGPAKDRRILVVVQLDGGNDALNTIVPHKDPNYAKLRPTLRVDRRELVKVTDTVGLHPQMRPLAKLLEAGQLAVIPGVGYPNPNRSHFRSMAIWHTARFDPEEHAGYGWLGRALDESAGSSMLVGSDGPPAALRGRRAGFASLSRTDDLMLSDPQTLKRANDGPTDGDDLLAYVRRQAVGATTAAERLAGISRSSDDAGYPSTALAERLRLAARLIKADLGARVLYTIQGGYDTHAGQTFPHSQLLNDFSGAVAAFFADLGAAKLADRVTLMSFSEFGRTIKENGSGGTDHGTAGAVFLAGPGVKGGLHGSVPSLTDLDGGEPKMTTDFRRLYTSVLRDWMGLPNQPSLGGTFEPMTLFA